MWKILCIVLFAVATVVSQYAPATATPDLADNTGFSCGECHSRTGAPPGNHGKGK